MQGDDCRHRLASNLSNVICNHTLVSGQGMGIRVESGCVDCGLPCLGRACSNYEQKILYCDHCGCEDEPMYWFDGECLCLDCILERLEEVKEEDYD